MLIHLLKIELVRACRRWQTLLAFALIIGCFIQGFSSFYLGPNVKLPPEVYNYYLAFLYAQGKGADAILAGVLPLAISLIAGDSLAWDRKTGYDRSVLIRTSYKTYILAKACSAAMISFGFIVFAELLAFVIGMTQFPGVGVFHALEESSFPFYDSHLFVQHPFVYVLLIIFNAALFGIVVSLLSVFVSTIVKNIYFVIATPWLLFLIAQFVCYSTNHIRYAPLDMLGLYMSSNETYAVFEIPLLSASVGAFLFLLSCLVYDFKFKVRKTA